MARRPSTKPAAPAPEAEPVIADYRAELVELATEPVATPAPIPAPDPVPEPVPEAMPGKPAAPVAAPVPPAPALPGCGRYEAEVALARRPDCPWGRGRTAGGAMVYRCADCGAERARG